MSMSGRKNEELTMQGLNLEKMRSTNLRLINLASRWMTQPHGEKRQVEAVKVAIWCMKLKRSSYREAWLPTTTCEAQISSMGLGQVMLGVVAVKVGMEAVGAGVNVTMAVPSITVAVRMRGRCCM
jgi:hypothetical protein